MAAPAFDATRFVRPALLSIALYFSIILISSMMMVKPAHAFGTVSPSITCSNYQVYNSWTGGLYNIYSTSDRACQDFGTGYTALIPQANGDVMCNTNATFWAACLNPVGACPANSTPTSATSCTCNDSYVPDPTGTSCVPAAVCPIPGLTPLTDPVAKDFDENVSHRWRPDLLTADYQHKLKCVEDAITARGGTYVGTSAYRPEQYQLHLFEIIKKDIDLNASLMSSHPECQALRDEVTGEMGPPPGHGLRPRQKVATPGSSRHEKRVAFDLTPFGLTDAQLTEVYTTCHVTHTAVPGEPWHVQ